MNAFTIIILVGLVLGFIGILALGFWHPASARQVTTGGDERRWATQAEVEEKDIDEMVDAQNVSRERRGLDARTEADYQEIARQRQIENIEQATKDEE